MKLNGPIDLLWFSRGRGLGHAIQDFEISAALRAKRPDVSIQFVSYGSGAAALRDFGIPVIDLDLLDQPAPFSVMPRAVLLIEQLAPRLVAAHEEFEVPAAASLCGKPCIFLTDWFVEPDEWLMRALDPVAELIFIDDPNVFDEPRRLEGRVRYVGPVLRHSALSPADRGSARAELGLTEGDIVVAMFTHPGRRTERFAPILAVLEPAMEALEAPRKKLIWLAGEDLSELRGHFAHRCDVIVVDSSTPFDQVMVACDLAITKGNRNIVLDLWRFGVPSVSISHGLNFIDDRRISSIDGAELVRAESLTALELVVSMQRMLKRGQELQARHQPCCGADLAAVRLSEWIPESARATPAGISPPSASARNRTRCE